MPQYSFKIQVPIVGAPNNEPNVLLTCSFTAESLERADAISEAIFNAYPTPANLPLRIKEKTRVREIQ